MKNRLKRVSLSNIFTIFALFLAFNCSSLLAAEVCDVDGNNIVDENDIDLIFQARTLGEKTLSNQKMDIDRNGVINALDARICVCALPSINNCEAPSNQSPVANPGTDQTLTQATFSTVNLSGSESIDPDSDLLSFLWSFQQRPQNSQAVLLNANTDSPSFTPDKFGAYVLSLTVTDSFDESDSNVVTINIDAPASTLQAIADNDSAQAIAFGNT